MATAGTLTSGGLFNANGGMIVNAATHLSGQTFKVTVDGSFPHLNVNTNGDLVISGISHR